MKTPIEQMRNKVYNYLIQEYNMTIEDILSLEMDDIDIKIFYLELYLKDNVYIEFFFQLPCKSLTPDTWMPLHRSIQERIWAMNSKNEENQPVIDVLDYFIFRLCRAIFERGALTEYDIELMQNNKAVIDSSECRELLSEVFFNYTEKLIEHIVNSEYTQIIPSFYSFKDY